jgi:hypothetical protein
MNRPPPRCPNRGAAVRSVRAADRGADNIHHCPPIIHIRRANRIVVLERGKVVETGTHQELLVGEGHYHRLYKAQFDTASIR